MKKGKKTRWLYKAAGMAVLLGAAFWCSNSGLLLWKPEVLTVLAESESGGSLLQRKLRYFLFLIVMANIC